MCTLIVSLGGLVTIFVEVVKVDIRGADDTNARVSASVLLTPWGFFAHGHGSGKRKVILLVVVVVAV